jgi:hypothetical protein
MMRTNFPRSVFLLAIPLIGSACSGGDESAAGAAISGGDPCSVLTAEAVSAALGKTVGAGSKTNEAGGGPGQSQMTTCTWQTETSGQGGSVADLMRNSVAVNLILWSWPSERSSANFIESFRKLAKDLNKAEPTAISLGDEAIRDGASVHVRKGTASFTVAVVVFGDADQQAAGDAAETLAKQVAAKL